MVVLAQVTLVSVLSSASGWFGLGTIDQVRAVPLLDEGQRRSRCPWCSRSSRQRRSSSCCSRTRLRRARSRRSPAHSGVDMIDQRLPSQRIVKRLGHRGQRVVLADGDAARGARALDARELTRDRAGRVRRRKRDPLRAVPAFERAGSRCGADRACRPRCTRSGPGTRRRRRDRTERRARFRPTTTPARHPRVRTRRPCSRSRAPRRRPLARAPCLRPRTSIPRPAIVQTRGGGAVTKRRAARSRRCDGPARRGSRPRSRASRTSKPKRPASVAASAMPTVESRSS